MRVWWRAALYLPSASDSSDPGETLLSLHLLVGISSGESPCSIYTHKTYVLTVQFNDFHSAALYRDILHWYTGTMPTMQSIIGTIMGWCFVSDYCWRMMKLFA